MIVFITMHGHKHDHHHHQHHDHLIQVGDAIWGDSFQNHHHHHHHHQYHHHHHQHHRHHHNQVGDAIWRDSFQTENEKTTLMAEKMSTMQVCLTSASKSISTWSSSWFFIINSNLVFFMVFIIITIIPKLMTKSILWRKLSQNQQELEQTTEIHLNERDLGNKNSLEYLQNFALSERLNFAGKDKNATIVRRRTYIIYSFTNRLQYFWHHSFLSSTT